MDTTQAQSAWQLHPSTWVLVAWSSFALLAIGGIMLASTLVPRHAGKHEPVRGRRVVRMSRATRRPVAAIEAARNLPDPLAGDGDPDVVWTWALVPVPVRPALADTPAPLFTQVGTYPELDPTLLSATYGWTQAGIRAQLARAAEAQAQAGAR